MLKRNLITGLFASVLLLTTLSISLTSCDRHNDADDTTYTEYKSYVVSVRDTSDRYWDRDWVEIERDYTTRKTAVEQKLDKMDEKSRAEYQQLENDWIAFKARYDERRLQRDQETHMHGIHTQLLVDPSDKSYNNLQGPDILHAYEHFETAVKSNMNTYSTQDWNEVNVIYNALKARRQAVMDQIPKEDKMKIQNIELGYETTMNTNKPFAGDEKKDK